MGAVVHWEYMDGSCGERHFGGDYKGAEEFARTEFADQPARVWYCGDIVQRGYIASDERGSAE
jgi:hypothetical protein